MLPAAGYCLQNSHTSVPLESSLGSKHSAVRGRPQPAVSSRVVKEKEGRRGCCCVLRSAIEAHFCICCTACASYAVNRPGLGLKSTRLRVGSACRPRNLSVSRGCCQGLIASVSWNLRYGTRELLSCSELSAVFYGILAGMRVGSKGLSIIPFCTLIFQKLDISPVGHEFVSCTKLGLCTLP